MINCILFALLSALDYFIAASYFLTGERPGYMWFSLFCGVVLTLASIAQFIQWREKRKMELEFKRVWNEAGKDYADKYRTK